MQLPAHGVWSKSTEIEFLNFKMCSSLGNISDAIKTSSKSIPILDAIWLVVFGETQDCASAAFFMLIRPRSIWFFLVAYEDSRLNVWGTHMNVSYAFNPVPFHILLNLTCTISIGTLAFEPPPPKLQKTKNKVADRTEGCVLQ